MNHSSATARLQFLQAIFPNGVPPLWCPPLTHYDQNGAIDGARMAAHFRHLAPYIGGVLIPGSTGDGWELTRPERRQVLKLGLEQARQLGFHVLIGALHPDTNEALALIHEDLKWLQSQFGKGDAADTMAKAQVCAVTVCPPRGQHLTQQEIGWALGSILELGVPTAIYQLPQVTQNELSPDLAAQLAARHGNFLFFKDTSGRDAVALSGKDLGGVFTARGAEGDYVRWLKVAGGQYDGFLLASANCFARELRQIIAEASGGRLETARRLSERLTAAISEISRLALELPDGNPFTNTNKAVDLFFAYGPKATTETPPRLHAGTCLPLEFIRSTGEILRRQELMPDHGYLESGLDNPSPQR